MTGTALCAPEPEPEDDLRQSPSLEQLRRLARRWTIQDRGTGWLSLRNIAGNICLDNYNWDAVNGARLSLYPCSGLAAQLWRRG